MLRSVRQVGQDVLWSSALRSALLLIVNVYQVKQPASLARWYLRGISGFAPEGPPAFVFDIDGVLIQGGTVLPEAKQALAKLYTSGGASALQPCWPFDFLANSAWLWDLLAHDFTCHSGLHHSRVEISTRTAEKHELSACR